jgi:hypothetical protein
MGIRTLQALGLAWDIKVPRSRQIEERDLDDPPGIDEAVA